MFGPAFTEMLWNRESPKIIVGNQRPSLSDQERPRHQRGPSLLQFNIAVAGDESGRGGYQPPGFDSNSNAPGEHILNRRGHDKPMLRLLATLAFAVSFDIILTGGKYVGAVDQIAVSIVQRF